MRRASGADDDALVDEVVRKPRFHKAIHKKRELLCRYITSEEFRQHVIEAGRLTRTILDLDADEKRAHDNVWEKRGKYATRLRNVVRDIDTEVSAVVEGRRSSNDSTK